MSLDEIGLMLSRFLSAGGRLVKSVASHGYGACERIGDFSDRHDQKGVPAISVKEQLSGVPRVAENVSCGVI